MLVYRIKFALRVDKNNINDIKVANAAITGHVFEETLTRDLRVFNNPFHKMILIGFGKH